MVYPICGHKKKHLDLVRYHFFHSYPIKNPIKLMIEPPFSRPFYGTTPPKKAMGSPLPCRISSVLQENEALAAKTCSEKSFRLPAVWDLGEFDVQNTYWVLSREWGNGMITSGYYRSFPHSLLSTSKTYRDWFDPKIHGDLYSLIDG